MRWWWKTSFFGFQFLFDNFRKYFVFFACLWKFNFKAFWASSNSSSLRFTRPWSETCISRFVKYSLHCRRSRCDTATFVAPLFWPSMVQWGKNQYSQLPTHSWQLVYSFVHLCLRDAALLTQAVKASLLVHGCTDHLMWDVLVWPWDIYILLIGHLSTWVVFV